ncbi:MAG: YceI family protein [Gammaproteobacteria bacterium]|nr:YceI family protein [Gammaproteobacteria bacterium]MBL6999946.1 YceI family protein [Gammaproteobacteria bacterium]
MTLLGTLSLTQPVMAEMASAGNYTIDPGHTFVTFSVSHLGFSELQGRFNTVEGSMKYTPNGASSVEVTIDAASVDSNHQKRDDHLRGPDFFNAKQFPQIKFASSKVHYGASGEPSRVDGNFTLHGVTKAVSLDVTPVGAGSDPWGGYRSGYNASTKIKRSDYGMNYMPGGIGDEISIKLYIELTKN